MIELDHITQHYSIRPVLKDVSLRVDEGELVVIVGPNGMGKSTLLSVMGGTLTPQKGTVRINGLTRRSTVEHELAIRRMALYLPDQPWMPALRTVREYILAVARLYDVPDDRLFAHCDRLLELFELVRQQDQPIRSLSSGQRKKAALCASLAADVPVMLLDEPFSGGLDPAGIVALKRVLQHRVRQLRGTIVLTSPVPEIVEEIADRIVIIREGQIVAFDTLAGLRKSTGIHGSLGLILERLLYPETMDRLKDYFQETAE